MTRIEIDELRELLAAPGTQLVEVLPADEYREQQPARRDQHPAQAARCRHHRRARPAQPGHRLLLGLPVRHEAHEPRAGSKRSASSRCTSTRRARWTGLHVACPRRASWHHGRPRACSRATTWSRAGWVTRSVRCANGSSNLPSGSRWWSVRAGVLLGRLRRSALEAEPEASAESVMEPGPTTVRPPTSRRPSSPSA